ncbi:MAG: hydroxymethylbilane synthase [Microthrixaceae bacterium]
MTARRAAVRIATRGSALARWQANHVAGLLSAVTPGVVTELVVVSTVGDRRADVPLAELGGKGVFVKEVQQALLDGRADLAVHSAKDLPARGPDELVVGAYPARADPRDALVGATLDALGRGATVATGSPRRQAQLVTLRPDLRVTDLRGNIATRLARLDGGDVDAVVVAAAALDRLGERPSVEQRLDVATMVPQVGQGALAVEGRADDEERLALLAGLDDPSTRRTVEAERALLAPRRRLSSAGRCPRTDRGRWPRGVARCARRCDRAERSVHGARGGPASRSRSRHTGDRRRRGPPRRRRVATQPVRRRARRSSEWPMTVYLVGAGPGDPGLLTVRGASLLARADVVIYDRLASSALLDQAPEHAERISVGKQGNGPSVPQEYINELLVERGRSRGCVVRLKGGDPFLFARGAEEVAALADAGVPVEVVPGVTSAIAAPAHARNRGDPSLHLDLPDDRLRT